MSESLFLASDRVLVWHSEGFKVLTTKGDMVGGWSYGNFRGEAEVIRTVQFSLDRSRFAFMVDCHKGLRIKNLELQRGINIVAFGADSLLPVAALNVKAPQQKGGYLDYGFALSPDGSHLALLDGADVSIYRLPPL
jgi:hypothetical protein